MGLAGSGFKNMKVYRTMMARRFPALPDADLPLDELPYITPQTVAYALFPRDVVRLLQRQRPHDQRACSASVRKDSS